jgi:8-oxo-dGTP pyrophosphatase MutT (NUDIX family)
MHVYLEQIRRAFAGADLVEARRAPTSRHAVVAAIVRQAKVGAEVRLIERADDERDRWSGHMGLPGGHRDDTDEDLLATAQRETWEEIGLLLEHDGTLLGRLDSARTASGDRGLAICPLVFALERDAVLTLNPREVKRVIWTPLGHLLSPAAAATFEYVRPGAPQLTFPAFHVEGRLVWGLTYRILGDLLDRLR